MQGIVNILKPAGMTSQKCVSIIKHKFNVKKVGHLGTLDPSGTGVLPICLGKATKLFDYYLNKDKVYRTIFVFSKETDTLDSDGVVIKKCDKIPSLAQIEEILPSFVGDFDQIPPNYSRKCVNGKRAYELARNNEEFELKPKKISIYNIKCLKQISNNSFLFEIHCSSGTYVRSICRDLAYKLGTYAYMGAIIRMRSGDFSLENAVTIEECDETSIISLDKVLEKLEKLQLNENYYEQLKNGVQIKVKCEDKTNVLIYCKGKLFGIADIEQNTIKIKTNLRGEND